MLIEWLKDAELEITTYFDEENDMPITETEIVRVGEQYEIDIFDDRGESINMQFGNGDVAYGVPKNLFRVIED